MKLEATVRKLQSSVLKLNLRFKAHKIKCRLNRIQLVEELNLLKKRCRCRSPSIARSLAKSHKSTADITGRRQKNNCDSSFSTIDTSESCSDIDTDSSNYQSATALASHHSSPPESDSTSDSDSDLDTASQLKRSVIGSRKKSDKVTQRTISTNHSADLESAAGSASSNIPIAAPHPKCRATGNSKEQIAGPNAVTKNASSMEAKLDEAKSTPTTGTATKRGKAAKARANKKAKSTAANISDESLPEPESVHGKAPVPAHRHKSPTTESNNTPLVPVANQVQRQLPLPVEASTVSSSETVGAEKEDYMRWMQGANNRIKERQTNTSKRTSTPNEVRNPNVKASRESKPKAAKAKKAKVNPPPVIDDSLELKGALDVPDSEDVADPEDANLASSPQANGEEATVPLAQSLGATSQASDSDTSVTSGPSSTPSSRPETQDKTKKLRAVRNLSWVLAKHTPKPIPESKDKRNGNDGAGGVDLTAMPSLYSRSPGMRNSSPPDSDSPSDSDSDLDTASQLKLSVIASRKSGKATQLTIPTNYSADLESAAGSASSNISMAAPPLKCRTTGNSKEQIARSNVVTKNGSSTDAKLDKAKPTPTTGTATKSGTKRGKATKARAKKKAKIAVGNISDDSPSESVYGNAAVSAHRYKKLSPTTKPNNMPPVPVATQIQGKLPLPAEASTVSSSSETVSAEKEDYMQWIQDANNRIKEKQTNTFIQTRAPNEIRNLNVKVSRESKPKAGKAKKVNVNPPPVIDGSLELEGAPDVPDSDANPASSPQANGEEATVPLAQSLGATSQASDSDTPVASDSSSSPASSPEPADKTKKLRAVRKPSWLLAKQAALNTPKTIPESKDKRNGDDGAGGVDLTAMASLYSPGISISELKNRVLSSPPISIKLARCKLPNKNQSESTSLSTNSAMEVEAPQFSPASSQDDSGMHSCDSNSTGNLPMAFECNYPGCWEIFTSELAKIQHKKLHLNPFSCKKCMKFFKTAEQLSVHERHHFYDHRDMNKFKCPKCDETFIEEESLRRHELVHLKSTSISGSSSSYPCSICKKTFDDAVILKEHLVDAHASQTKFYCLTCKRKFATRTVLQQHCSAKGHNCD